MNKLLLLIIVFSLSLSGCLGIPTGHVAPGDSVSATIQVQDAETGELLIGQNGVQFIVGSGSSGVGREFERQLIAKPGDFAGQLSVSNDPSLQWTSQVSAGALFESPLVQEVPVPDFVEVFGEPFEGMTFDPPTGYYSYLVVSVENEIVSFQPTPEPDQRDELAHIGAILHTTIEGDNLVQTLEPDLGATFNIQPPSPFGPATTPLGLAPGLYRTIAGDGQTLTYERSDALNAEIIGRPLLITVQLLSHTSGGGIPSAEPVNGNYGVRQSQYINGQPSATYDFGPLMPSSHGDGHDHDDGHTH